MAEIDLEQTNSYLKERETWYSNEDIVGKKEEWKTTVNNWKTAIENLIKHNVDRQILEIDLSECHPQKMITYLDEELV